MVVSATTANPADSVLRVGISNPNIVPHNSSLATPILLLAARHNCLVGIIHRLQDPDLLQYSIRHRDALGIKLNVTFDQQTSRFSLEFVNEGMDTTFLPKYLQLLQRAHGTRPPAIIPEIPALGAPVFQFIPETNQAFMLGQKTSGILAEMARQFGERVVAENVQGFKYNDHIPEVAFFEHCQIAGKLKYRDPEASEGLTSLATALEILASTVNRFNQNTAVQASRHFETFYFDHEHRIAELEKSSPIPTEPRGAFFINEK